MQRLRKGYSSGYNTEMVMQHAQSIYFSNSNDITPQLAQLLATPMLQEGGNTLSNTP